jgi:hypothetical protein
MLEPMQRGIALCIAVTIAAGPAMAAEDDRATVAVMNIHIPETFPTELKAAVSAALTETLDAMRAFDSISDREVAALIRQERAQSLLREALPDVNKLASLGAKLDADLVVIGGVVHEKGRGEVNLQLLQVHPPKALERVSRPFEGSASESLDVLRVLVRLLVRDVLAERSGRLRIIASEEGATVYANGKAVGSTPLDAPIELAEGLNSIEVEREGFIRYRRDVEVVRDRDDELEVTLTPSMEFIERYKASVTRRKWMGWGMIGFGGLAAVGAVTAYLVADGDADALRSDIDDFNAAGNGTTEEFEDLQDRESSIATLDVVTVVAGAVAVSAVTTGVVLLLTNDRSDRYDGFLRSADASPAGWRWAVGPTSMQLTYAF